MTQPPSTLRTAFQILSNTALFIVALTVGLETVFWIRDSLRTSNEAPLRQIASHEEGAPLWTPKRDRNQLLWIDTRSYSGIAEPVREQVFDDFYDLEKQGKTFKPFVHFSIPPFSSKTVNTSIDPEGFTERQTNGGLVKATSEIVLLGGSNTFGWLLADDWTMASYLQEQLTKRGHSVRVRNYGIPYYSWPQEFILFSKMLEKGRRPKTAIFVDGVNYAYTTPMFSDQMEYLFEKSQFPFDTPLFQANLGIFRMVNSLGRTQREKKAEAHHQQRYGNESLAISLPRDLIKIRNSYLETKKQIEAIGNAYGVKTLFVWQPTRLYHCSTEKYRTPVPSDMIENVSTLYPLMAEIRAPNYLYLGDFCSKLEPSERVFIDGVHYNPSMNKKLAEAVLGALR